MAAIKTMFECTIDNEKIVLKLEKDNAEKMSLKEKFVKCEINCGCKICKLCAATPSVLHTKGHHTKPNNNRAGHRLGEG